MESARSISVASTASTASTSRRFQSSSSASTSSSSTRRSNRATSCSFSRACRSGNNNNNKKRESIGATKNLLHHRRRKISNNNNNNKTSERGGRLKVSASLPSVGSTQWLVEQGALSIVAAGAFLFRDRIKALVGENNESADGRTNNFFGSGREDCPTCEGTGYATCACTKWSNDGEGCGACNYTCRTICPSCRGGGKGVRATLDLKIDDEETDRENMRRQRERETHSWEVWNKNGTDSSAAAALVTKITTPTMNPLTTPLICLPVVSAPESNEGGGRRSVSSSDSGNGSKNRNKKEPDDEFYAQSGEAIRTLREDYPFFLSKEPRFTIFRENDILATFFALVIPT